MKSVIRYKDLKRGKSFYQKIITFSPWFYIYYLKDYKICRILGKHIIAISDAKIRENAIAAIRLSVLALILSVYSKRRVSWKFSFWKSRKLRLSIYLTSSILFLQTTHVNASAIFRYLKFELSILAEGMIKFIFR